MHINTCTVVDVGTMPGNNPSSLGRTHLFLPDTSQISYAAELYSLGVSLSFMLTHRRGPHVAGTDSVSQCSILATLVA